MADGDGEGATEFHDYEGGGIGEGEGTKDVSDKIENEDQVMKLQPLTSCFIWSFQLHFMASSPGQKQIRKFQQKEAAEGCGMKGRKEERYKGVAHRYSSLPCLPKI